MRHLRRQLQSPMTHVSPSHRGGSTRSISRPVSVRATSGRVHDDGTMNVESRSIPSSYTGLPACPYELLPCGGPFEDLATRLELSREYVPAAVIELFPFGDSSIFVLDALSLLVP